MTYEPDPLLPLSRLQSLKRLLYRTPPPERCWWREVLAFLDIRAWL